MKLMSVLQGFREILRKGPKAALHRHKIALRLGALIMKRLVQAEDNPQQLFQLAEALSAAIYPDYKFSEFGRSFLQDQELLTAYKKFHGQTNWHSLDRKFFLRELLKLVDGLEGDTAECGVFEGASSYFICRHVLGRPRTHHLFDSFEGLSEPQAMDGAYWRPNDLACPEDRVRANLVGLDPVAIHKGWIPSGFSDVEEVTFSFVHLDVDLYQPTLDSLQFFYPRLPPGGILLCDDYGFVTCPGARKAMDEFFADKPEPIIQSPSGQGFVIKK